MRKKANLSWTGIAHEIWSNVPISARRPPIWNSTPSADHFLCPQPKIKHAFSCAIGAPLAECHLFSPWSRKVRMRDGGGDNRKRVCAALRVINNVTFYTINMAHIIISYSNPKPSKTMRLFLGIVSQSIECRHESRRRRCGWRILCSHPGSLSRSMGGDFRKKKRRLPAPERAHIYEIDLKSGWTLSVVVPLHQPASTHTILIALLGENHVLCMYSLQQQ